MSSRRAYGEDSVYKDGTAGVAPSRLVTTRVVSGFVRRSLAVRAPKLSKSSVSCGSRSMAARCRMTG